MTKKASVLLLLEWLNKTRENGERLMLSYLNDDVLHATRSSHVLLLTKVVDCYIDNLTKSKIFHAFSFYYYAKQLLQMLYGLVDSFNNLMEPGFLAFTNEKFAAFLDERGSINQMYSEGMRLCEYDRTDTKKP